MDEVTYKVRAGKAEWNGRLLAEWVPDLVEAIVQKFDPERVVLLVPLRSIKMVLTLISTFS